MGEGTYLEPDKKYGYASINSLSKALFNKLYKELKFNYLHFNKTTSIVAIQVQLYYIDLINEIIKCFTKSTNKYIQAYIICDVGKEKYKEILSNSII